MEEELGKRYRISCEDENIYIFLGNNGKHEVTIPHENLPQNAKERLHMDAIMRKLSELHGYYEEEEEALNVTTDGTLPSKDNDSRRQS